MIINQRVITKWNRRTKQYYSNLGYEFTKYGNELEIDVFHLPKGSSLIIKAICDYCNESLLNRRRVDLKDNEKDCCINCMHLKVSEIQIENASKNGNSLAEKFPELIKEWSNKNEKTPYDYAYSSNQKVFWQCEKGHEWESTINDRTNKKSNCKNCTISKGEDYIRNFLINNNIKFKQQYSFDNLLNENKNKMKFDFAAFNNNMILIEYDGKQHFEPIYGEENLKITQYRDNLKNKYCKKNNITLLRIPHWEFDNIENILKTALL